MASWKHYYIIRIQFLGFRYHGWQKQAGLKSIHGMIDKTMLFILEHDIFRTLGCGRTDAKVSANDYAFELFTIEPLIPEQLLHRLNKNLPSDIKANNVQETTAEFNIIQNAKMKEYRYYFSSGSKSHPFNAPIIRDFGKQLDTEKMEQAAIHFAGKHNFKQYVSKPSEGTEFMREILHSSIEINTELTASFMPNRSYYFRVISKGFMRYQVRLMMGALVDIGRGTWSIEELRNSISNGDGEPIRNIAPSSGLMLYKVDFE
ncbi:MAG: tRNA pseudouridine38-40 synthase [Cyclobacteriaceae bacterium]|jgi:tRNA pseudouridine38-40 synthase